MFYAASKRPRFEPNPSHPPKGRLDVRVNGAQARAQAGLQYSVFAGSMLGTVENPRLMNVGRERE